MKRVDKIEHFSGMINCKIDKVLGRLEETEGGGPSSRRREEMSRLMDDFVDGKITRPVSSENS